MVGGLDHIQIVLDDHHRVAHVHQLLEHLNELVHVGGVQAGGGLVQDIDGLAGGALGQLGGQLDPLGLAAGQGGGGLAQLDVAQAHLVEGLELVVQPGEVLKEGEGLLHRHLQHLIDVLAFVAHLQGLPVVPLALAHLAGHVDVGEEVHLNFQQAVALAGLAAPAPDVEGEAARAVAPGLGVGGGGEQITDVVEQAGIGGRVGAGGAADGGLVNVDDLIQELLPLDARVLSRPGLGPVQVGGQPLEQDLVDQGGLAGTGHAGDAGEGAQGDGHVHAPQVVLRRAPDGEEVPAALAALGGDGDPFAAGQVVAGDGAGGVHDLFGGAGGHHLSAVNAGAGADVHDIVGRPHGVLVVLYHQQGVAQVAQVLHGVQQHVVVPLVQTDGRLVQNIEHPHEGGADLGGQADALALAAGQGGGSPAQSEVLEPHTLEEAKAVLDLLEDAVGDEVLLGGELQAVHEGQGVVHRLAAEGVDADTPHRDGQGLLPQALAAAVGAGPLSHALLQIPAHGVALGLPVAALQVVDHALEGLHQGALAVLPVVGQLELLPLGAVEDHVHDLLRQFLHRGGELEAVFLGEGLKVHAGDGVTLDVVPAGGGDGALQDGELPVGDDEVGIHLELGAQAGAGGTGAVGVVEGEHAGGELLDGDAAVFAGVVLGEEDVPVFVHNVDDHQAAGQGGGGLHAVGEAAVDVLLDDQPVHHNLDVVLLVLVQGDLLGEIVERIVGPAADIARLAGVLQQLLVGALLATHHRGHDLDAGGLGQGHHLVDDLVDGLLLDLLAALGAVGGAHPRPQQAEVVVDLRHRAHGGAGVLGGGLLVDGDGGGQAVDVVHVRLLHLAQEHAGVGGEGLHIAALALGVDGVKGQGGLARAGQAGEHHQLVPGNVHVDVFQVVLPRAFDENMVEHTCGSPLFRGLQGLFAGPGRPGMADEILPHGPPFPVVFPALPQGHSPVFIAGGVLVRGEHVVLPEAHRADVGNGLLFGDRKGEAPAAGTGVAPRRPLRLRLKRLRSAGRAVGRGGHKAGVGGLGQIEEFFCFVHRTASSGSGGEHGTKYIRPQGPQQMGGAQHPGGYAHPPGRSGPDGQGDKGEGRKPQQKRGVHDQQCVPAHIPPAHVQYPNTLATPSSMSRMGRP